MATSLKRAPLEIHPQHHSFKLTCIALAATSTPTMTQNIEEGLHAPTLLEIFGSSLLGHASWCLFNVWRERIDEVATLYDESGNIPLPTIKTWKRWWYKLRWLLIMRCYVKGGTLVPITILRRSKTSRPIFLGSMTPATIFEVNHLLKLALLLAHLCHFPLNQPLGGMLARINSCFVDQYVHIPHSHTLFSFPSCLLTYHKGCSCP